MHYWELWPLFPLLILMGFKGHDSSTQKESPEMRLLIYPLSEFWNYNDSMLTRVDLLTPDGMSHRRIQWSIPALSTSSSSGHITVRMGCVCACSVSSGVRVVALLDRKQTYTNIHVYICSETYIYRWLESVLNLFVISWSSFSISSTTCLSGTTEHQVIYIRGV